MNEQNTREAAINEAARSLSRLSSFGGRKKLLEVLFDAGMVAGAASVDRVAIVREAFEKVKFTYANGTWPKKPYDIAVVAVMDAVLAEMEKGK